MSKVTEKISYTAAERESIIRTDDADGTWSVYTTQSKIANKLKRVGIEPTKVDDIDGSYWFENIPFNQVSFRAKSNRTMSEEQRQAASERAKKNLGKGRDKV